MRVAVINPNNLFSGMSKHLTEVRGKKNPTGFQNMQTQGFFCSMYLSFLITSSFSLFI